MSFPQLSVTKPDERSQKPRDQLVLPSIKNNSLVGKEISNEDSVVIDLAKHQNTLPQEWTDKRVNGFKEDETRLTKLEWENQIARHILSLFATTNATKDVNESKALLDFTNRGANEVTTESAVSGRDHNKVRKKKKKSKKVVTKEQSNTEDVEFVQNIMNKVYEENKKVDNNDDKYRINNTIKTRDGKLIVVRGTPRCYPIWFVSTGDVFSDWSILPGGKKFQAQLNVIYEQKQYKEYITILEILLLQTWREIQYGRQQFEVGSFGKGISKSRTDSRAGGSRSGKSRSRGSADTNSLRNDNNNNNNNNNMTGYDRSYTNSVDGDIMMIITTPNNNDTNASPNKHFQHHHHHHHHRNTGDNNFGSENYKWEDTNMIISNDTLSPHHQHTSKQQHHHHHTASSPSLTRSNLYNPDRSIQHPHELPQQQYPQQRATTAGKTTNNTSALDDDNEIVNVNSLSESDVIDLWKQLVLTTIAFGTLCIERKQFDLALELLNKAETWSVRDDILKSSKMRRDLKAYVRDAMSYYFFKKGKSMAAIGYSKQALEMFEKTENVDAIAACQLHIAAIHNQLAEFKEAHRVLFQFLAMVESGRLATANATPKQLCMVAIGYHNLAVCQLKLLLPDLACKNSQNARKIARLCLSYSNRWIDVFQYTHEIAIADVKYDLGQKRAKDLTPEQLAMVKELAEALFDPETQA